MTGSKRHIILTGASKGFGRDLSLQLAAEDTILHLIARSDVTGIIPELEGRGASVRAWRQDLSMTEDLADLMHEITADIAGGDPGFIALINNAGMIDPVGPAGQYDFREYKKNLEINFTAPLLLTHQFIGRFQSIDAVKRVVMVSSGAAFKPYHGWSHYCSTKAGVEMFVRAVSIEQEKCERPVSIVAFNPGRISTQMQEKIRKASSADFPMVDDFISAWENGLIGNSKEVARLLAGLLMAEHFPSGERLSVRDL